MAPMMQAITIRGGKGGADALQVEDVPVPALRPGHVLVRVRAAGVNRPDLLQRAGRYPPPPGRLGHPRARGGRRNGCGGRGRDPLARGRSRDGAARGWRLCGVRAGGRSGTRCPCPGPRLRAGGGAARDGVHRVGQRLRGRTAAARRDAARTRCQQRHRCHGDPDGESGGCARVRNGARCRRRRQRRASLAPTSRWTSRPATGPRR